MEAASLPWRPIGELFVARGVITHDQLEEALAEQAASGKRLGEILVDRQLVSSPELTQTLMEQLGRQVRPRKTVSGRASGPRFSVEPPGARVPRCSHWWRTTSRLQLVHALRDSFAARAAKARSTELALGEPAVDAREEMLGRETGPGRSFDTTSGPCASASPRCEAG